MLSKITTINSDSGLPNEQIHAIDQDKYGGLWLASPAGLVCYNGSDIKVFDSRSGLECPGLRTVKIADDGIIWIGTDRGIEAISNNGSRINLEFGFEWKYGIAESILVSDGNIWVGTSYGLLRLKKSGETLSLEREEDLGFVSKLIVKDSNSILAITVKFGLIETNIETQDIFKTKIPASETITCLKKTLDNFYLAGTYQGLYVLNNDFEIIEKFALNNEFEKVEAIAVSGDEWWIAFGHLLALVSRSDSGIKIIESIDIGSKIKDIFIDKLDNVWIATNNSGLKKISCLRKALQHIDCGIKNSAFSIKEIPGNKKLMIGGDGFCSEVSKEIQTTKSRPRVFSTIPTIVWDTCVDPVDKSIIWLATEDGLHISKDGEPPELYQAESYFPNSPGRVLLTRDNEIWLGTISGLFIIKNKIPIEVLNVNGEKFGYVFTLSSNSNNQLMIGTLGQGLWIETNEGICQLKSEFLTDRGNIYSVMPGYKGNIVVIQDDKIILFDNDLQGKLITQEYPVGGWASVWINQKTIAIGSNDGIVIIDTQTGTISQRINLYLGKAEWQFTSSRALYFDNDERLFCGLNFGLYVIDLKKIQQFNTPPKVYLNEITWENITPKKDNEQYYVKSGNWSVNFSVYSAWFIDEKQVQFRFKLIGFDEYWSELSPNYYTRYNSLLPGKYQLQCQAFTNFTGFGEVVTIIHLNVLSSGLTLGFIQILNKIQTIFDKTFNARRRNILLFEKNKELQFEITERKLAEEELRKYKEQLEEIVKRRTEELKIQKEKAESADKIKSIFLANMSHEIRTPIATVIGLNKILQKTNLDQTQLNYVSKIQESGNHLLQVINDILDISKIESGKIDIENIEFSMYEIVDYLAEFSKITLKNKRVQFNIETGIRTSFLLMGDPLRLKQVLLNLLSNAFKFTEEGTVQLSIKQLNIIADKADIRFTVSDTGIGITEQQIGNLFKAFQQADSTIARKYGGTGLGLSISYKLIELLGGELKVKSVYGEGTTFYFTLSFGISTKLKNNNEKNKIKKFDTDLDGEYPKRFDQILPCKILVVEDDTLNQFILNTILQSEGFSTIVTGNGLECIKALKENSDIDLILMDLHLPEMDGLETTRFIRSEMKNDEIVIIGLSANLLSEAGEQVLTAGMNDFISKPIIKNELFSIMYKWLNEKNSKI